VADMRANVSLNVPVGCDLGAVASQPDRGTAYSEPWIEDSFQETWPHARRDPETLLDGEDPVIRRYPREDVDGTEYRYRAATSPQRGRLEGDGVALGGATAYQDAKQQEEANLLLAAEWQRQRDNRRCCAQNKRRATYAYPDALACLEKTGCKATKVYLELEDECEMACSRTCPKDLLPIKVFRHPTPDGQPGRSPEEATSPYTACGGTGMVWKGACKPADDMKGAGAGLAPGLAAGLAAAVASVSVYY